MTRGSLIFSIALLVLSGVMAGLILKGQVMNPMESRTTSLEADIDNIEIRPVFYIAPSNVDYNELNTHIASHSNLWRELVPPPKRAAPVAKGPDFKTLLQGVVPSRRREMKVSGTLKVHIITPSKSRGFWAKVGDTINGMKIVGITPTHIVFEKHKNKKAYTYSHPRQ